MDANCLCAGNCDRIVEPDVPGSWSGVFCTQCRTFRSSGTSATPTSQQTTSACVCTDNNCVCKSDCERYCDPQQSIGTSDWAMWFASTRCVPCRRYYISLHSNETAPDPPAIPAPPRDLAQAEPIAVLGTPSSGALGAASETTAHIPFRSAEPSRPCTPQIETASADAALETAGAAGDADEPARAASDSGTEQTKLCAY